MATNVEEKSSTGMHDVRNSVEECMNVLYDYIHAPVNDNRRNSTLLRKEIHKGKRNTRRSNKEGRKREETEERRGTDAKQLTIHLSKCTRHAFPEEKMYSVF